MNEFNLLWSAKQNAFHVERVADTLKNNLNAFHTGRHTDYVTLLVADWDQCCAEADRLRPLLAQRERIKAAAAAVIDAMRLGDEP